MSFATRFHNNTCVILLQCIASFAHLARVRKCFDTCLAIRILAGDAGTISSRIWMNEAVHTSQTLAWCCDYWACLTVISTSFTLAFTWSNRVFKSIFTYQTIGCRSGGACSARPMAFRTFSIILKSPICASSRASSVGRFNNSQEIIRNTSGTFIIHVLNRACLAGSATSFTLTISYATYLWVYKTIQASQTLSSLIGHCTRVTVMLAFSATSRGECVFDNEARFTSSAFCCITISAI